MRIAALVTQPRGGPVDHAVDVACELADRGHDSHLIGPVDAYADRLAAAGVHRHDVAVQSTKDLAGARELRRLLRSLDADVLHLQDRRAGLVGRVLGRGSAERLIYSVHGVADALSDLVAGNVRAAPRRRTDLLRYLTTERVLDRLSPAQIVVPCRPVGVYAVEHARFPAGRVHVVANGVDPARFAPRPKGDDNRTTVLWLGVMAPVKRLHNLLRAVASVPDVRLVLAGDGPQRAGVEALVDELDLRARVELLGHVPDPAQAYGDADVFALPSAAEALPLALLQAMSSGLPVVASRVGGIPDVVRPGIDGLLVAPDDIAGLAGALRELATDAEARRTMGKQARERVLADFTLHGCVDGLLAVYRG